MNGGRIASGVTHNEQGNSVAAMIVRWSLSAPRGRAIEHAAEDQKG